MRRSFLTIALLVMLTSAVVWRVGSAQDVDVQGAWLVSGMTDSTGAEIGNQPGLYIFTGTHYSIMFVPGTEPRAQYDGDVGPTDADRLAAYQSIIANSGRYQVSGDQLSYQAYVAKDPNYMGGFPDNSVVVKVHRAGDTLHITYPTAGVLVTLQRVEGTPPPMH